MAEHSLTEHLLELRQRLLRMVLFVLIIFIALFSFANELYQFVAAPLLQALPTGSTMIATDVASPFLTPFKLALVASIFLSIPYILFETWRFIAPGLFSHEKRVFLPMLFISILLFYAGAAFAFYAVFPVIFAFFSSQGPVGVTYSPDITSFLDTALKLLFAFGLAFEIPVVTMVLVRTGATTVAALKQKRPFVVVGCFFVGMLLTPPDPISQCLMAIPMWLLFEAGLLFSRLLPKAKSDP